MKRIIHGFWSLKQVLFPDICLVCNSYLNISETKICITCTIKLPITRQSQFVNGMFVERVSFIQPLYQVAAFTYFSKNGVMQHLIHEFKYHGNKKLGQYLAMLWALNLQKTNFEVPDFFIFIPITKQKFNSRGYNQAKVLADVLSLHFQKPVLSILNRLDTGGSQTTKNRRERMNHNFNPFNVISLNESVENKHVMIIDDVLTTGATLFQAHSLIRDLGISKISLGILSIASDT